MVQWYNDWECLNVPMELEWTTELGKLFHKDIIWGGKEKEYMQLNWTDKGEIMDETSCTRVVVYRSNDQPMHMVVQRAQFQLFLHAAMQGGNIEVLKHSQVI